MEFKQPKGATPIDDEQKQGLIPDLTTQGELNEFEANNILEAMLWAKTSRKIKSELLEVSTLQELHKRMYGKVWRWAGEFRSKQTNIGDAPRDIQNNLKILLDDVKFWIENKTYSTDEIVIRFHHRLVEIHPFPNGNGRHARLATDLLLEQNGAKRFSWGSKNLVTDEESRERYIGALKRVDNNRDDISELLKFARN